MAMTCEANLGIMSFRIHTGLGQLTAAVFACATSKYVFCHGFFRLSCGYVHHPRPSTLIIHIDHVVHTILLLSLHGCIQAVQG